jgi:G:T-mismatch repair DNA endonuclease (very short patch repair protein)
MKTMVCHICNETCRSPHYAMCNHSKISKEEFKFLTIVNTYPQLGLPNENIIRDLYCVKETSIPEFKKLGISWVAVEFLLSRFKIKLRTHKDSMSSTKTKIKIEQSFIKIYGAKNPLCAGTTAFEKKNNTVREKYGVENVRQLKTVKDKITETHLLKYGEKRCHNGEAISLTKLAWTDEHRLAISAKISITKALSRPKHDSAFDWKALSVPNKLESKVASALAELGLPFQFSFWIAGRQFDFKVGNLLIEVQGDFWHANPLLYKADHILSFPGKKKVKASDLWEKDAKKVKLAHSRGFRIIHLWEKDLKGDIKQFVADQVAEVHPEE